MLGVALMLPIEENTMDLLDRKDDGGNVVSTDETATTSPGANEGGDSTSPASDGKQNSQVESGGNVTDATDPLVKPEEQYTGLPKLVEKDFTYPTHTDPQRARDTTGGVYLDDVQRQTAEVQRAKLEGREPDLKNPPATQGTPLIETAVVKSQMPGDFVVEPDVTLPVVIGFPETDEWGDPVSSDKDYLSAGVESDVNDDATDDEKTGNE